MVPNGHEGSYGNGSRLIKGQKNRRKGQSVFPSGQKRNKYIMGVPHRALSKSCLGGSTRDSSLDTRTLNYKSSTGEYELLNKNLNTKHLLLVTLLPRTWSPNFRSEIGPRWSDLREDGDESLMTVGRCRGVWVVVRPVSSSWYWWTPQWVSQTLQTFPDVYRCTGSLVL